MSQAISLSSDREHSIITETPPRLASSVTQWLNCRKRECPTCIKVFAAFV